MQAEWATPTAAWLTTASVVVSMTTASFAPATDATTWRPSGVSWSPAGFGPTSIDPITVSLSVPMTLTAPESVLDTYTFFPSSVTTRPSGAVTGMVLSTALVVTSTTATALSPKRPTYAFRDAL